MSYQEILEGITRHRANPVQLLQRPDSQELERKFNEIEWALQALAERLAETENIKSMAVMD